MQQMMTLEKYNGVGSTVVSDLPTAVRITVIQTCVGCPPPSALQVVAFNSVKRSGWC